jgi:subfamily B ATP-binding cassette protein HlyB/CyaB
VVIDKVLVHRGLTTLHVITLGMVGLAVFEAILGGLRTYVFSHTTCRIAHVQGDLAYRGDF